MCKYADVPIRKLSNNSFFSVVIEDVNNLKDQKRDY
jgi:hypothetical protein